MLWLLNVKDGPGTEQILRPGPARGLNGEPHSSTLMRLVYVCCIKTSKYPLFRKSSLSINETRT